MFVGSNAVLQRGKIDDTSTFQPSSSSHSPVTYNRDKDEKSPDALFQQRIPKEYLTLQEHIREKLRDLNKDEKVPVLSEKEFR